MFRHYTAQLLDGFGWKMTFSMAGTVIATIQGFYGELLWAFLAMFVLDFMSGIGKSLKNGIPIVSRRLRDSVTKLGGYMLLITALTVITYFDSRWSLVLTSCYWFFIFTEFKSILENAEEMGAKVPKPLIDLVNTKLKEIIKVFTNKSK